MAKTGPKPLKFDLNEVEQLAGMGLTQEEVALNLGCSTRTVGDRLANDAEFADAYKRGQAKGHQKIANMLFTSAIGGDVTSAIFFAKARMGWKDRIDHTSNDNTIGTVLAFGERE